MYKILKKMAILLCVTILSGSLMMPVIAEPGADLLSENAVGYAINWPNPPSGYSTRNPSLAFSTNWNNNENYWMAYLSSHTITIQPWYIVDLQQANTITSIEFTGRAPGSTVSYAAERRNFEVQVSNDIDFGNYVVVGSQGSTHYSYKTLWTCSVNLQDKYRYVRIIKTALENLSLTGLKVYGTQGALPMAWDPVINGELVAGETVYVSYNYSHDEGVPEGESKIQWFTADDIGFEQNIREVSSKFGDNTYTISSDDVNRYLFCVITPYSIGQENNIGLPVTIHRFITIRASLTMPGVFIITPVDGIDLMKGTNPVFAVDIEIQGAEMVKVEYYINNAKVGESISMPSYSYEWINPTMGSYILMAKAYNSLGEIGVSQEVNFKIVDNAGPYSHIGSVHKRLSSEISGAHFSIGSETLDRDYAIYSNYKEYLDTTGAKLMRLQGGWAKCEKVKGVYDWAWLDESIDHALSVGVTPWVNTCYGNPIYEGGGGTTLGAGLPTSLEALEAWDNWVSAMVTRYKDKVYYWEIWNEADHSTITMTQYVNFFIRTSDLIRSLQPDSKIIGLAGSKTTSDHVRSFLDPLKNAGKINNLDIVTVHGYPTNPDDSSYRTIKSYLPSYSSKLVLWNGETGVPHRSGGVGAFSGFNGTEVIQQKWILRRMLSARSADVPISIFCLVDLQYENGTNYKGLLKTDRNDKTVIETKLAFDSYRNATSIFDDTLVTIPDYSYTKEGALSTLHVSGYENVDTKKQVVAIWNKIGTPVNNLDTTKMTFTFSNGDFADPVYIDLRDGKVYQMNNWTKNADNSYTFIDVPIYDSPILIADKSTFAFNPIGISVENVSLYSSDGASGVSSTLVNESTIAAKATASNTGAGFANLTVMLALYDQADKLIGISMSMPTMIAAGAENIPLRTNLVLTEQQKQHAVKAKVMVWNLQSMTDYAKTYEKVFIVD